MENIEPEIAAAPEVPAEAPTTEETATHATPEPPELERQPATFQSAQGEEVAGRDADGRPTL